MFETDYGTIDIDDFEYFIETSPNGFCASADCAGYELEGNEESTPQAALRDVVERVRHLLGLEFDFGQPVPDDLTVCGYPLK